MNDNLILHTNKWYWGESVIIVRNDGFGLVTVQFDSSRPDLAFITGLSVFENERRKGIGKELICSCFELIDSKKKTKIELTVEKNIKWLYDWYISLGFKRIRTNKSEYLMQLDRKPSL